jgi:hypothetical protein
MLQKTAKLIMLASVVGCSATAVLAQKVIFAYGGDYVSSGQPFRLSKSAAVTPSSYSRPFSESVSLTPIKGGLYSGPQLFGGWETAGKLQPASASSQVAGGNDFDALLFRFRNAEAEPAKAAMLLVSMLESPVGFSNLAGISVSAFHSGITAHVRPVIKINDNYYVGAAEEIIPKKDYPFHPQSLAIKVGNWLRYNPEDSISALGESVTLTKENSICAVGLYFSFDLGVNPALQRSLYVKELKVTTLP